jgi:hypothetical protein
MSDLINAVVTEVLDREVVALRLLAADPGNANAYGDQEMLRVIASPERLRHREPSDDVVATAAPLHAGDHVRCRIETRGSDGVLIGEVDQPVEIPLHRPAPFGGKPSP